MAEEDPVFEESKRGNTDIEAEAIRFGVIACEFMNEDCLFFCTSCESEEEGKTGNGFEAAFGEKIMEC